MSTHCRYYAYFEADPAANLELYIGTDRVGKLPFYISAEDLARDVEDGIGVKVIWKEDEFFVSHHQIEPGGIQRAIVAIPFVDFTMFPAYRRGTRALRPSRGEPLQRCRKIEPRRRRVMQRLRDEDFGERFLTGGGMTGFQPTGEGAILTGSCRARLRQSR